MAFSLLQVALFFFFVRIFFFCCVFFFFFLLCAVCDFLFCICLCMWMTAAKDERDRLTLTVVSAHTYTRCHWYRCAMHNNSHTCANAHVICMHEPVIVKVCERWMNVRNPIFRKHIAFDSKRMEITWYLANIFIHFDICFAIIYTICHSVNLRNE